MSDGRNRSVKARGLDLSKWNTVTSFEDIKNAGYDFVILRIGGTNYGDPKFRKYYLAAKKAGLKVGAYFYAGRNSIGAECGARDAEQCMKLLKPYKLEYPVYYDFELAPKTNRGKNTDGCISFCECLEAGNYFVGIYASDVSGFKNRLLHDKLSAYSHWVADYSGATTVCKDYHMRQVTSRGTCAGVVGYVDINEDYVNLGNVIKKAGKNV